MFYSQCLLSKKGALGTIWVAAHCLKRLKKDQVYHTNISSSVDKILVDEVPVVTHRVLAFLLLGVVKIYSQKVEYLYDDCNRVVDKINDFSGIKKKASKVIEGMRAPRLSITRPKSLELDTFDLQILEDGNGNGDYGKAAEDITLEDACTNEAARYHSPEKIHHEAGVLHAEPCSTAQHTPVQDVFSPYTMEKESYTKEKDIGSLSLNIINSEPSLENFRENNFSLDDRLDPMVLGETEGENGLFALMFKNDETDGEHTKPSENKDDEFTVPMSVDVTLGSNCSLDSELPVSEKRQPSTQDCHLPMSVDVTFPSKSSHDSVITPEFISVKTPVIRERGSSSRKRKCLLDEVVVLSNKVVKDNLNDTSGLVCKRRKAPLTTLHAWKRHQISNLPRTFSEPLFPCSSLDLRSLFSGTKLKGTGMGKKIENAKPPEKLNVPESPARNKSPYEAHVSPSTPVTESASLRTNGDVDFFTPVIESEFLMTNGDVETTEFYREGLTSTFERTEREESSQSEEEESEKCLNSEEINSQGGVNQESDEWSDRTRLIARQLCKSLLSRKKRGQNKKGKSLLQTLKKKTKNESAVFFYETLVLKTRGYIDVEQNDAYGDIVVMETIKLKQACETGKFN